jgi:hypothetical protein
MGWLGLHMLKAFARVGVLIAIGVVIVCII